MTDEYWIAGLAYSPLPGGRASPRRRFIKSPFPPITVAGISSPLPSPPMTPNSTTPPPPRPKSRANARRTPVQNTQNVTGLASPNASPPALPSPNSPETTGHSSHRELVKEKRIMLRELLPRVLATPALESHPDDMARFGRLQTLALHIFQDPCAFDQDELGRFLAQPLELDALRVFSDTILDSWTRAAPAAIRIPPNAPIRIVDPNSDLSNLETTPLELCSAATCACLLWTNMHPERWLQIARASLERGGGALDLTAEVRVVDSFDDDDVWGVGVTRSGMNVSLMRVRTIADTLTRIRHGLQPWQKASHSSLVPLYGVREDSEGLSLVCAAAGGSRQRLSAAMPKTIAEGYRMMRSLAKALRYLHQLRPVLVHGGVRPDVVLVTPNGDVQLAESGLSKILEECSERAMPAGGIRYTAPEIFGENKLLAKRTQRSDVYAFGCVLYEVFAGEQPFADIAESRVPRTLYDRVTLKRPTGTQGLGINDELWSLITRCCAFDLSKRPTMAQVVTQLAAAKSGSSNGSTGTGPALEPSAIMALVESVGKIGGSGMGSATSGTVAPSTAPPPPPLQLTVN